MIVERIERRVLGAVELLDATTERRIAEPMEVTSQQAEFRRTRLGLYAIMDAEGLGEHLDSFEAPPAPPAVESLEFPLRISDPRGGYLPRRTTLRLPRDPSTAEPLPANSLFRPVRVTMFAAPAALTPVNWAVVRASVVRDGTNEPLEGVLVLVREPGNGPVRGRGLSDERGEALAAVEGIPAALFNEDGEGPVTATEQAVEVIAVMDPTAETPPDPDDLENRIGELLTGSSAAQLATGREVAVTLSIQVPG